MSLIDRRFEHAKAEVLRLTSNLPTESCIIQSHLVRLLSILRSGRPDVSEYQAVERKAVIRRQCGFNLNQSQAYKYFQKQGWDKIPRPQLCGFVKILAFGAGIFNLLDRDAKREKRILFLWLEEHWDQIKPVADTVILEYIIKDPAEEIPSE
jgi:hypothetical protein